MSRIGKQLIKVPSGVEVIITPAVLSVRIKVKGPKGELSRDFKNDVVITREGDIFTLKPVSESIFHRALWGTYASHLKNMIEGVTDGFTKRLLIEGIGFKADIIAGKLQMALGYSHPIIIPVPAELKLVMEKGAIVISGVDKDLVGEYAARIIRWKKPEPYKGKGIRHEGQTIRRKQGKKSVA